MEVVIKMIQGYDYDNKNKIADTQLKKAFERQIRLLLKARRTDTIKIKLSKK